MRTWILIAVMAIGFTATAQKRGNKEGEKLTPEQRVSLQVKKLTLALSLNENQQVEVTKLLKEKSKDRQSKMEKHKAMKESGERLTKEQRFAMREQRLDEQIEMKNAMKQILTPEQFEKFEEIGERKHRKITNRRKNIKKHNRE